MNLRQCAKCGCCVRSSAGDTLTHHPPPSIPSCSQPQVCPTSQDNGCPTQPVFYFSFPRNTPTPDGSSTLWEDKALGRIGNGIHPCKCSPPVAFSARSQAQIDCSRCCGTLHTLQHRIATPTTRRRRSQAIGHWNFRFVRSWLQFQSCSVSGQILCLPSGGRVRLGGLMLWL